MKSQVWRVSCRNPDPSAPSTSTTPPFKSVSWASLGSVRVSAHDPKARFLEELQSPGQIRDRYDGRRFCRANSHFASGRIQLRRAIFGNHDGKCATCISGAQASAEVVRVLHAIEHENDRIFRRFERADQIVFRPGGRGSISAITPWWETSPRVCLITCASTR